MVDLGDDGDGDVQIFDGVRQTIAALESSVSFSTTNTLELRINDYGASLDYEVNVNGNLATGLSFTQNQPMDDFGEFEFSNAFGASAFTVDNFTAAEVIAIPEPSTFALLLSSRLGLSAFRRQRSSR